MKNISTEDPSLFGIDTGESFILKCRFCSRNMASKQNLKEHLYIHSGEKPYKCTEPNCTKSYRQGSLLSMHRKKHKKQEACFPVLKKSLYLKLTDFISASALESSIQKEEIESIKSMIGEKDFKYVSKFLRKIRL